jgi:hypothetical protein
MLIEYVAHRRVIPFGRGIGVMVLSKAKGGRRKLWETE